MVLDPVAAPCVWAAGAVLPKALSHTASPSHPCSPTPAVHQGGPRAEEVVWERA